MEHIDLGVVPPDPEPQLGQIIQGPDGRLYEITRRDLLVAPENGWRIRGTPAVT